MYYQFYYITQEHRNLCYSTDEGEKLNYILNMMYVSFIMADIIGVQIGEIKLQQEL